SREQIAVLLYKYALYMGYDTELAYTDLSAYTDIGSVSGYAETAVRWAIENGIISGSGSRLDPQGVATRAQAAALLERFVTKFCS
ncbi:MAG: S-layer homology domain-containing protein, partial [Clostridiales bacterium]|nr:S-layer homology domain-containing protein [Clostridiales bacterium]